MTLKIRSKKVIKKRYETATEHELVKQYEVSRHTIRKALDRLEQDGYIHRIPGREPSLIPNPDIS